MKYGKATYGELSQVIAQKSDCVQVSARAIYALWHDHLYIEIMAPFAEITSILANHILSSGQSKIVTDSVEGWHWDEHIMMILWSVQWIATTVFREKFKWLLSRRRGEADGARSHRNRTKNKFPVTRGDVIMYVLECRTVCALVRGLFGVHFPICKTAQLHTSYHINSSSGQLISLFHTWNFVLR